VSRSVGTHAGALQPRHNESSSEEDDADDLPSATALGPIPAAATGTTSTSTATPAAAADNCHEVCVIDAVVVSTESSAWAPPAARFVALISRW